MAFLLYWVICAILTFIVVTFFDDEDYELKQFIGLHLSSFIIAPITLIVAIFMAPYELSNYLKNKEKE
jgi:hypothetical protein